MLALYYCIILQIYLYNIYSQYAHLIHITLYMYGEVYYSSALQIM